MKSKKKKKVPAKKAEGLVRVKLQRALLIPIDRKVCKQPVPKDEIVRVTNAVYEDYKGDLKRLGRGKTTAEESKKKPSFMEKVISSKSFAVNK